MDGEYRSESGGWRRIVTMPANRTADQFLKKLKALSSVKAALGRKLVRTRIKEIEAAMEKVRNI